MILYLGTKTKKLRELRLDNACQGLTQIVKMFVKTWLGLHFGRNFHAGQVGIETAIFHSAGLPLAAAGTRHQRHHNDYISPKNKNENIERRYWNGTWLHRSDCCRNLLHYGEIHRNSINRTFVWKDIASSVNSCHALTKSGTNLANFVIIRAEQELQRYAMKETSVQPG
ncbi:MAG: hypothetical protein MK102_10675 [Fuerstiella sp.]|nr:hypothetical protein [Fuerstiella sp.]